MYELSQILSMIQCEAGDIYMWHELPVLFSACQESDRNSGGSKGSGVVVAKRRACKA